MNMIECIYCHERIKPKAKNPDSVEWIVGVILLFIGIVPGVIYLMWKGSGKQCPKCKMKIG